MAVTLVGEVINTGDSINGFNTGTVSTDDDNVQGTGALGIKASSGVNEMYTTSLGPTAPYNFSAGGSRSGHHIIMWFNTKTPVDTTNGLRIVVGNGTSRGHWNVYPRSFYKGGFVTAVVNTARPFDTIATGSWTTGGNPAQLTSISQVGGVFNTLTSIMGNFNNMQLDQFTVGLGVRVDGGTVGTPNNFETVRAVDEDTNKWGWWSSSAGSVIGKGKLYIGPASGSATSVFSSVGAKVIFANERVAAGFYEIAARGAGTAVSFNLSSISAASSADARWGLTVDSTTQSFSDTNGVWSGGGTLSLSANSSLVGTTLVDCQKLNLNGASVDSISVLSAATTAGNAFITTSNLGLITNSDFAGSTGHAIEITTPGNYSFSGNVFSGYGIDGSTNAAIYNNSGGLVTINISGGGNSPTVRNGTGATTNVVNAKVFSVTNVLPETEIRIFRQSDLVELGGVENVTTGAGANNVSTSADPDNAGRYRVIYSYGYTSDIPVFVVAMSLGQLPVRISAILRSTDGSLQLAQTVDRPFFNP